ncbi:hypothetical protein EDM59_01735 [Brevibacillus nitrificans]|uniref:Uncharacterized protein n=1 Tax=Brevibacillus nitrificans TaxID=651560 RepID=A0A3M8DPY5_9BACL|nr:hypothetical protein [Brevibacillus nitrificans]RNB90190.1 hypothetical protein EDM59_01735 [Brevibacillus nitrificans]
MNAPLLDFPEHIEKTELIRQQQLLPLAFDSDERTDKLAWTVRDVIEELELLIDMRATMVTGEFQEGVRDQARRLFK